MIVGDDDADEAAVELRRMDEVATGMDWRRLADASGNDDLADDNEDDDDRNAKADPPPPPPFAKRGVWKSA